MASLMNAPDVLKKIEEYKKDEVAALYSSTSIKTLREQAAELPKPRGFRDALTRAKGPALIAEVKKASPSKGLIREDFDPVAIAAAYKEGGATCLSILTDGPGFQGSNKIFKAVRAASSLPLLRKDFMIDPIQITESAALGADCILIIMAMVDDATAQALYEEATILGLDALIETHDEEELDRALKLGGDLIGINNRDLRTFETTLDTFTQLASKVPEDKTLIAESGIFTRDHIKLLEAHGAKGYLVGESLMRQDNLAQATRELLR